MSNTVKPIHMNAFKLALREIKQDYYLVFKPIIRNWRIKNAIKAATNEFIRTREQHYVLKHDEHDCEVLSKTEVETRLKELKKKDKRFRKYTIYDIRKTAIYCTPAKIYSGNLNAFGIEVKGSKPIRVKYDRTRGSKK
jgi:hypothetical protein